LLVCRKPSFIGVIRTSSSDVCLRNAVGGSSYEIQEEMAQRRIMHGGVMLTTTNTMVAELVQNWATPAGIIQLLLDAFTWGKYGPYSLLTISQLLPSSRHRRLLVGGHSD
jgi:hypothetical protein